MTRTTRVYTVAAIAGAVTGLRSMTGPAIVSRSLASGLFSAGKSSFKWLGARRTANTFGLLALGELVADKLPLMPNRTNVAPLVGRLIGGGLCGAAICASNDESPWAGALIGGLTATGAAFAGYELRKRATQSGRPDTAAALLEDAVAIGSGIGAIAALR